MLLTFIPDDTAVGIQNGGNVDITVLQSRHRESCSKLEEQAKEGKEKKEVLCHGVHNFRRSRGRKPCRKGSLVSQIRKRTSECRGTKLKLE